MKKFLQIMLCCLVLGPLSVMAQEPPMLINHGVSGSWYEPATSGQGFALDVVPSSNTMVAYWYTYLENGNGREWFFTQGGINGAVADLVVYRAEDGVFDQTDPVSLEEAGTLKLTFESCSEAKADYALQPGGLSGSIPLQRLTDDISCTDNRSAAHSTFVTASNSWLNSQGLWLFEGCVNLGASESHGDERFWFDGTGLMFEIDHYQQEDCNGPMDLQEMTFELTRVDHSIAHLNGQQVISNRTVLRDPQSGGEVKQIWYFDEVKGVKRMSHGDFDSASDLQGYPSGLHNLFFELQPGQ